LAKQALYQLSYFPDLGRQPRVRVPGFEPGTSALSELRSSQLSYTRDTPVKHKSQTDWVWLPRPRVSSGELAATRRVNGLVPGNGGRNHSAVTSRGRLHPGIISSDPGVSRTAPELTPRSPGLPRRPACAPTTSG